MADAQGLRILSWLDTGSGLRAGKDARGRLRGSAAREGTDGRAWPPAYGKGNSVYRRPADGWDWGVWPRRMVYRPADLDRFAADSTVGRAQAIKRRRVGTRPDRSVRMRQNSRRLPSNAGLE